MYNILIVEDDSIQAIALSKEIKQSEPSANVTLALTYYDAIEAINSNVIFDFFFLDIALNGNEFDNNGLNIACFIRNHPNYSRTPIVFVTSITKAITIAVNDIHCHSFLKKPYTKGDIQKALKDIKQLVNDTEKPILFSDSNGANFRVLPSDIISFSALGHKIKVTTKNYSFISRDTTMEKLVDILPDYFVRCHKSYIVNVKYVDTYDKVCNIITINRNRISLGRMYKVEFERRFKEQCHII